MDDRRFARKLILLVLVKIVILFGLWLAFFSGQRVLVSSETMANAIQSNHPQGPTSGEPRHGN